MSDSGKITSIVYRFLFLFYFVCFTLGSRIGVALNLQMRLDSDSNSNNSTSLSKEMCDNYVDFVVNSYCVTHSKYVKNDKIFSINLLDEEEKNGE